MNKIFAKLFLLLSLSLGFAPVVYAVPPPDFIFNLGSQLAYVFSFVAVFISAAFSVSYQYIRTKYHAVKMRPRCIILSIVLIVLVSLGSAYSYGLYKQKAEYEDWLVEVEAQEALEEEMKSSLIAEEIELDGVLGEDVQEKNLPQVKVPSFWDLNQDVGLSISNEDFQILINSEEDYLVLDARENLEFAYGKFPGSTHIRYADLLNGDWDQLPNDRVVYVLCWSGMRGEEVAQFLRSNEIVSVYLADGADGWVSDFGGLWEGSIKFSSVYPGYEATYSTDGTRSKVAGGVILVDAREEVKISMSNIEAVPMPLMETPSDELEAMYAQVPLNSTVITICDDWINCFMAKLVGVELEIRGHEFLGRYNSPWEW